MVDEQSEEQGLWYKDAIIYQLHVRAFNDSNGDGIGDFAGLTAKLDYLQDLGVTALWLLPFYPSPLRDDGYDTADYTDIHPAYGTLRDFREFLREAHRRGLRVITELVLNHTSDQHPWFQKARHAEPGSAARKFYVWSDTPNKYTEARIIFKDFETSNWAWDPVAKAYYWHRFYSHQPDLNYENPAVFRAMTQALDFWLRMGVDGLRLDAVPYLFEEEGTNCENLPQTHAALKQLRRHIDQRFQDRMLLAEANQWPEDAVAYFGDGDECHMAFNFPVMPRMFMAIRMEDRYPIVDIMSQTPTIPDNCQWALFLRNHDELTLEMVTDEERDYMYRVYARDPQARINLGIRRRLAPLLGNHRRRIELMNGLLFALPGTPIIYYGDEIGMGDNIFLGDRNGVRTPMQWSADRNAGFSQANPQRLYLPVIIDPEYHFETVNVQAQNDNPHSLLWWMRRLIALRKRYRAFSRGTLEFLYPDNRKVLAFLRRYEDETILVVANLSRFVQYTELNLAEFRGLVPVEIFGRIAMPPISDTSYFLTLGPHSFYWFALERSPVPGIGLVSGDQPVQAPVVTVTGPWQGLFSERGSASLARVLPRYLKERRWFRGKARPINATRVVDSVPIVYASRTAHIALVQVDYTEGDAETYVLPLTFADGDRAALVEEQLGHAIVARVRVRGADGASDGLLYDASWEPEFAEALLDVIGGKRRLPGAGGELTATTTAAFRALRGPADVPLPATLSAAEQSNTSMIFSDRFILKLFRRLDEGINPDYELGRFLTERTAFQNVAPVAGALEYRPRRGAPMTMGLLQGFVPNQGDAWQYTLDVLVSYFEQAATQPPMLDAEMVPSGSLLDLSEQPLPTIAEERIGGYLEMARLLGQRTGEMHLALASARDDPALMPEPFTTMYQRSVYQSIRSLSRQTLMLLRRQLPTLPEVVQPEAERVLAADEAIHERLRQLLEHKIGGQRIRVHGDYHLGQVLFTGRDFVIIDFEGEPARTVSERRIKRSPLRDAAGMIRSFHYAAWTSLLSLSESGVVNAGNIAMMEASARFWYRWVAATFLRAYRAALAQAELLPQSRAELEILLDTFTLEKAIYELGYELNNRPTWTRIPLQGITSLLGMLVTA